MAIPLPVTDQDLAVALESIRPFVPRSQLAYMLQATHGEEGDYFRQLITDLAARIAAMPKTFEQSGAGDAALVHLHYFFAAFDWFITEKDMEGVGTLQAFGLADMGCPELGYICIDELLTLKGMQLDLHWKPESLQSVRARIRS